MMRGDTVSANYAIRSALFGDARQL